MTRDEILAAVHTLAACDHFDESRRAAQALPADMPLVDILRAADGATRLAHALNERRRSAT